ncbi:hypothetical protein SAMN05444920_10239 [Nonomuraea solani]|uniref:Secreted protein n=1 Tax=Nonomuraea solani TaxID=1144553 RepID=A0A1H5XWC2_9ACTN|nr:hypothetical protein [Nonomuraea solani]SEG15690.1 hypothetical protein SAMN05444920_10239 [Nonomuraea solani]
MKRLALPAIAGLTIAIAPAPASAAPPPDTCRNGYVWREARPSDHVCVTPGVRDRTTIENRQKQANWVSGEYGPHTCRTGLVWREAFPGDDVCVTGKSREEARGDNVQAESRQIQARLWINTYRSGPTDNGDGTATTTSVDDIPRLKLSGSHYNFGEVKVFIYYDTGRLYWSGTVKAIPQSGWSGGSWGKRTGKFDCRAKGKPANAYARALDVASGRWSAKVPLRVGCSVY